MMKLIKSNPIKLIFIFLLLGVVTYRIATVEPKGFCSGKAFNGKTGVYLTDEEFIFATLKITPGVYKESGEKIINPSDELIKNYMGRYPECCRVYKNEDEFSSNSWFQVRSNLMNRMFGREQIVVVEHRDLVQVEKGTGLGESQAMVSVCGHVYSN
jgi:hypothetical protein